MPAELKHHPAYIAACELLLQNLCFCVSHKKHGKCGVRISLSNGVPHVVEEDLVATHKTWDDGDEARLKPSRN